MGSSHYAEDTVLKTAGGTTTSNIGSLGNNYPAYVKAPEGYTLAAAMSTCGSPEEVAPRMAGFSEEVLASLATLRRQPNHKGDYGNMEELDDAGTSFQLQPVAAKDIGCWSYVSTRNNNFSNRSQKGTLCVDQGQYERNDIGLNGGALKTEDGWVSFEANTLTTIYSVTFESTPADDAVSPMITVEPEGMEFEE